MPLDRSIPALLALALLLLGCPPELAGVRAPSEPDGEEDPEEEAEEDDWIDDDDAGDEVLPLPEGDCGRYAWLETQGARLEFDQWPDDLWASSWYGLFCASFGDEKADLWDCYSCDEEGVRLVREHFAAAGMSEDTYYDDPPLIWRHDAGPGSVWTADWSASIDGDDGSWSIEGEQTVEVIGEEQITVPAGTFDTLVVRRTGTVSDGWEWSWISEGLGPVQDGYTQTSIARRLVEYEGL